MGGRHPDVSRLHRFSKESPRGLRGVSLVVVYGRGHGTSELIRRTTARRGWRRRGRFGPPPAATLGARFGAMSMVVHAAAVPLGFVAVTLLAVPAFCIGMAHAGVELDVGVVT